MLLFKNISRRVTQRMSFLRRILLGVGVVSIVIMTSLFVMRMRHTRGSQRTFYDTISYATHNFEEGMALLNLNPIRARELLKGAHDVLEKIAHEQKLSSAQKKQIEELSDKIQDGIRVAARSYDSEPAVFFDLSLLKEDATAQEITIYQNTLALLDRFHSRVYRMDLLRKNPQIVSGGQILRNPAHIGIHGEAIFITTLEGIMRIRPGDKEPKVIIPSDKEWGGIVDLVAYAGNLYLLDKDNNQIWKYIATDTGFSDRRTYLNLDTFAEFSTATSFSIDTNVWVSTGKDIEKFVQGRAESFTVVGLEESLGKSLVVFTNDATNNLYILDKANKRVVVIDKQGVYQAQYKWKQVFHIDDLIVSEQVRTIILLSGSMMYEIPLK